MTYDMKLSFSTRVRHAIFRRMRRVSYLENLIRRQHRLARADYLDRLPWLDSPLRELCQKLQDEGVAQLPLTELGIPYDATLKAAEHWVEQLRKRTPVDSHFEMIPDDALLEQPEPYLFGLSQKLLDLAERYMGLPVDYLGVNLKRELANGQQVGTRLWHADPEDERVLKIIVYLSDVDEGAGPFAAVEAPLTEKARWALRYDWGTNCTSEALEAVVPKTQWRLCTGPRLTAVFCDTARCLHRASPPLRTDRYSMTFSYLSREAYFCFSDGRQLQQKFRDRYRHLLDARQLEAVTPREGGGIFGSALAAAERPTTVSGT